MFGGPRIYYPIVCRINVTCCESCFVGVIFCSSRTPCKVYLKTFILLVSQTWYGTHAGFNTCSFWLTVISLLISRPPFGIAYTFETPFTVVSFFPTIGVAFTCLIAFVVPHDGFIPFLVCIVFFYVVAEGFESC